MMISWRSSNSWQRRLSAARPDLSGVMAIVLLIGWVLACGGGESVSTAKLRASVEFSGTVFTIKNLGAEPWRDVELRINDDFRGRLKPIAAGESGSIFASELAKSDGTRFNPIQFKPQNAMVIAVLPNGQRGYYTGSW